MITITIATEADTEVLALLGRITYAESHGHFIDDKNDLTHYMNDAFSVARTKQDLNNAKNMFYLMYVDNLPVGYVKLILNATNEYVDSQNNCRLDRIYILNEFIPLKIGQQLLSFAEEKAKELQFDTMWLAVYTKNHRAIRFYERNEFIAVGELNFPVNGTVYENVVYSKKIEA